MTTPTPQYDLRPSTLTDVAPLFEQYHAYKGVSRSATYCFAVWEEGRPVAAFAWQPPPVGAAKSVCPEAPYAVLALSRMVAVPRADRQLNHISRPLRFQMKHLIDRSRWPVLITYSDEGLGHTGHVYKCSGWEKTTGAIRPQYEDSDGRRSSTYRNGRHDLDGLTFIGHAIIQRWEHWACPRGCAQLHIRDAGWERVPVPGKKWRSGAQAYTWAKA